jgi:hypothetical protein
MKLATLSWTFPVLSLLVYSPVLAQRDSLVINPNNVTTVQYGASIREVWAALGNAGRSTNEWQFRYGPLFIPEVDKSGKLVHTQRTHPDGRITIQIPIILDNPKARTAAFEAVKAVYKERSKELVPGNVYALNIGTLDLSIPALEGLNVGAKLTNLPISFIDPTDAFTINIEVPNKESAEQVIANLPYMRIDYNVSYNAKSTKQNVIRISYTDLRKSALYNRLDGLKSSEAFVHRDDLRQLTEGISKSIDVDGIIEDPHRFDADVAERILSAMTSTTNTALAQFDAKKWEATYNSDDLKPDVIEKTLNKTFTFDQGSKQGKRSGSIDTGAKVGLFDALSAEGKFAGNFSMEDLRTWLKQHSVEAAFEGSKIVVKSLDLQRVNMSEFQQNNQFTSRTTIVSSGLREEKGNMDFGRLLASQSSGSPLPDQVAQIALSIKELSEEIQRINGVNTILRNDLNQFGTDAKQMKFRLNEEFSKFNQLTDGKMLRQIFRPTQPGAPGVKDACNAGEVIVAVQQYYEDGYNKHIYFCSKLPRLSL